LGQFCGGGLEHVQPLGHGGHWHVPFVHAHCAWLQLPPPPPEGGLPPAAIISFSFMTMLNVCVAVAQVDSTPLTFGPVNDPAFDKVYVPVTLARPYGL